MRILMKPILLWPKRGIVLLAALLFLAMALPAAVAQTATLSGSGSFGSVAIGGSSARTFTLRNSGTATLTFTSASASGDFHTSSTCPNLAARGTCSISVTFTPTASGSRTGTLSVVDSAGTQNVNLTGTGAAPVTM